MEKRTERRKMKSELEMVAFPLLLTPIEIIYRACTIPYRFPSDNPGKPTPTELQWIQLFLNSIPSFKKRAETDATFPDTPARADEENAKAKSLFADVVRLSDAIEDEAKRLENLVRGIFAGNIFDLGSAQLAEVFSKDGISISASCQNLVPRPWVIDGLETFKVKWSKKSRKKVIDLSRVSYELAYFANDADLVILEGMVSSFSNVKKRIVDANLI